MPRTRNIKPAFFANEYLADLPYEARLLFIGIWTLADRRGRLEDRPKGIKGRLFPYDNIDIDQMLQALADSPERFIIRYSVEDEHYIQITNFERHQHPHVKETESEIPPPPNTDRCSPETSTMRSQYKHESSTIQESCEYEASTSDYLIPNTDYLLLNTGESAPLVPDIQRKSFVPPDIEEVKSYCAERAAGVDAQKFIDFYSAKGWMIGKNKMKDWRAAVRTWEKTERKELRMPEERKHSPPVYLSDLIEYPAGSGQYRPRSEVPT